jgi:type I restriction enzyme R subunit
MKPITEDKIEQFAIEQLQSLGWEYIHGSIISPEGEKPERENYEQIILTDRLRKAILIINPLLTQMKDTLLPKSMSGEVRVA